MENLIQYLQGSLGNPENLFFLSVFMAVVLLVMGGVTVFAGANPVKRRLKTRVQSVGSMAAGRSRARTAGSTAAMG